MAGNSQSMNIATSLSNTDPSDIIPQTSKYLLTMISPKLARKWLIIGFFNILLGIVSIGLDVALHRNHAYPSVYGTINGLYMICVGILILILCREQVYVLTNFFILIFFQIIFLLLALTAYVNLIFSPSDRCRYSYIHSKECQNGTNLLIANLGLIIILIMLCVIIYSLVLVRNGLRPRKMRLPEDYGLDQVLTTGNVQ